MSFFAPDLIASGAMPTFWRSPSALRVSITTPMEPVTVVGWATMVSAASAT